ncbi:MAG TPA: short-chain dehydrogenase, partial [Porticoccaceae bacterium]|nr:short-chain dehydrogenase [Porticoccaceae bacterium]
ALNMLLKTAAIEYARRIKNVKIISFHPGTTDTPLSKPFQSSVPSKKLFTTDFVASCLLREMDTADVDGQLSFLDWDGARIEW